MAVPSRGRRGAVPRFAQAFAVLLGFAALLSARAEEPAPPAGDAAAEEVPPPCPDAEARGLAQKLCAAAKRRDAKEALAVLEEIDEKRHAEIAKALLKVLDHADPAVAMAAADAMAAQRSGDAKADAKLAAQVWKGGWQAKANDKRFPVLGRVLLAVAALERRPLEERRAKEVEKAWRWVVGNPEPDNAPGLVAVCEYVSLVKDKRFCRLLAEEIDEPVATDPNSPSNPPASWWEARWKLWKQVKAAAVETLEDLTDQTFKTTKDAKAWFEANAKQFGFTW